MPNKPFLSCLINQRQQQTTVTATAFSSRGSTPKASQVGLRVLVWFPAANTLKRWESPSPTSSPRDSWGWGCACGVCCAAGREPGNSVLVGQECVAGTQACSGGGRGRELTSTFRPPTSVTAPGGLKRSRGAEFRAALALAGGWLCGA